MQRERERERESCARAGKERPRALAAVSIFRCIIFSFVTSRIHTKHVQIGHVDACRGNKHANRKHSRIRALVYGKLLGAHGSRLPLPNG